MKPFITPEVATDGRKVLRFQVEGIDAKDLGKFLLEKKVLSYALPTGQNFRAVWLFRLFLDEGCMLEFSSACTEVSEWQEVGSLNIAVAGSHDLVSSHFPDLPRRLLSAFQVVGAERLTFADNEVRTECGLVLIGLEDAEIAICAGIPPGSVSVQAPFSEGPFEPQFAIARCIRETI